MPWNWDVLVLAFWNAPCRWKFVCTTCTTRHKKALGNSVLQTTPGHSNVLFALAWVMVQVRRHFALAARLPQMLKCSEMLGWLHGRWYGILLRTQPHEFAGYRLGKCCMDSDLRSALNTRMQTLGYKSLKILLSGQTCAHVELSKHPWRN